MRTFAYCRVSTAEQNTETQIMHIRQRGYDVADNRVVSEVCSGSVPAAMRPEWLRLIDRIEAGDTVVVLKLDRLGRDNIDVQQTISALNDMGVKVVSLDLPVSDLTSAEGKMMLQMFSAFAEFERNRIRERTVESLARLKADGVKLGRPEATETTHTVQVAKRNGLSQSEVVKHTGLSLATVKRHWNKAD